MAFRRDIEGLRAVAVLGVVIAHAGLGFAAGGFSGVDVFYVISGFLITGILVRELEGRDAISLVSFYARRARRILPMAGLVIVVVLIASLIFFSPLRRDLLSHDAVASSLYLVNWRFIAQSADYFGPSSDLSPLQHYWSLAIEEQFYLVWPAVLLIASLWWRRRGRPSRRAVAVVLGVIASLSLAYSVAYTDSHLAQAYFSTFTRAWELALGGLLALAPVPRLSDARSRVLAGAGLAAILVAFAILDEGSRFPGYIALLPTLGAVAVIAAGAGRPESPPLGVLGLAPVRYVGRVSYAWYLWHWPFVVFAASVWGPLSAAQGAAAVAASLIPAVISHHLVERPLMEAKPLRRRPSLSLGLGAGAMAAGLAAAALVIALQPQIPLAPASEVEGAAALSSQKTPQRSADALRPNPIYAADDQPRLDLDGCLVDTEVTETTDCSYDLGDATTDVVLLGDSHGAEYFPPLERIGRKLGWRLTGLTKNGCPPSLTTVWSPKLEGPYRQCDAWRENALERIEAEKPDLVIVAGALYYRATDAAGARMSGSASASALASGDVETLERIEATGARVAAIGDIPETPIDVPGCVSESLDSLEDCGFPADARPRTHWDLRAIRATEGVTLVDVTDYVCPDGFCRAVIGNAVTYLDSDHLTATFARTLAPIIQHQLGLSAR